jgi:precorrin-2 dehydrogenase / sirohydrochlorin ferrochelatase
MSYYPVYLDLRGQRCAVIGGGAIAVQKARGLLEAGADVTVIASDPEPEFEAQPVTLVRRHYRPGDLEGFRLVIDTVGVQEARAEATARGILLNVVDKPAECDFIAPAVVRRGDLQLAVSTAGESPFLASALKAQLYEQFGDEWAELTHLMGNVRRQLRRRGVPLVDQKRVYDRLLRSNVLDLLRHGALATARRHARAIVRQALAETQTPAR